MDEFVTVIGGGLAGCEAAYQIAKRGVKVKLYEMKPTQYSPAHSNQNLAEIVCSNSFKSKLHTNACGLLKEELKELDSLLIKIAEDTAVPAGQALAVDRERFAQKVTESINDNPLVEVIRQEVKSKYINNNGTFSKENPNKEQNEMDPLAKKFDNHSSIEQGKNEVYIEDLVENGIVIIATGPLTSDSLSVGIEHLIGENSLSFYDAAAPIIDKDSINFEIAFYGDRYEQERGKDESIESWKERIKTISKGSYINLPMNKEEYELFVKSLVEAEVVTLHDFEKRDIFEGCMPIEIMAKRGLDTLRFGPLKPVGFTDPRTGKRPYAVVQLRQDNSEGSLYNMVGFQTNLKFGEQKRVFSTIPGLANAEFIKYGVMHRNTYINSSILLDETYNLKLNNNVFFAGQITGVEGYVESISSGLVAGINAVNLLNKIKNNNQSKLLNKDDSNKPKSINRREELEKQNEKIVFPKETMIGALAKYISTYNENFQPMNANYGILPELDTKIKDKKLRYKTLSDRALEYLKI